MTGKILCKNDKGFLFIIPSGAPHEKIFGHASECADFDALLVDALVEFEPGKNAKGRIAKQIRVAPVLPETPFESEPLRQVFYDDATAGPQPVPSVEAILAKESARTSGSVYPRPSDAALAELSSDAGRKRKNQIKPTLSAEENT